MPSNHLILCLFLLLWPSIFPSIRVFSNDLAFHMRWPKNWSFSFSIISSNEYSGLISFMIYWFDLLAIQGTLKSLLQDTTVQKHQFFGAQLSPQSNSHIHMWKNHSLDKMDLCWQSNVSAFDMLSRLVITFLPRSKRLLMSWLQSPSAVILEPPKIKSDTVSTVSPSICHEVMEPDATIFVF